MFLTKLNLQFSHSRCFAECSHHGSQKRFSVPCKSLALCMFMRKVSLIPFVYLCTGHAPCQTLSCWRWLQYLVSPFLLVIRCVIHIYTEDIFNILCPPLYRSSPASFTFTLHVSLISIVPLWLVIRCIIHVYTEGVFNIWCPPLSWSSPVSCMFMQKSGVNCLAMQLIWFILWLTHSLMACCHRKDVYLPSTLVKFYLF